ncbi:M56 family metallopeptidase [Fuerstiella marisgermanici]|uniref:Regulatory protein BlaR1 n=1 Tax=Fuerstiella marisgermanici TaxID=1891926 RepID=A0A1P8WK62_9PLAN|nr:M56 family metallopeptidase [Fuerstiella marisgermanici]APZ94454.1 Regulatory protein BlaR1 [Fuerstiella marisgermanici]
MIEFEFVNPTISARLSLVLMHSLWQFTLLATGLWIIERLWRRLTVQRSYALHVSALCAGLLALPVTWCLIELPRSLLDAPVASSSTRPELLAAASKRNIAEHALTTNSKSTNRGHVPEVKTTSELAASFDEAGVVQQASTEAAAGSPSREVDVVAAESVTSFTWVAVTPWLVAAYAVGVMVMLVRLLLAVTRTSRLVRTAMVIADGALVNSLKSLAEQWAMKSIPILAATERIIVPQVVGLVRPTILLPASALTGLTHDQLVLILTHEMAHLRRHDMWVNLLQRIAETLLFYNPPLWYVTRRISTLREYCCDDLTCDASSPTAQQQQVQYATALLRVVEVCSNDRPAKPELASLAASGHAPSELRRRIARLFGEPLREPLRVTRGGLLAVIGAVGLLLAGPFVWPATGADEATAVADEPASNDEANLQAKQPESESRLFSLKVVGPNGKPLPKAQVQIRSNPSVTKDQIVRGEYVKDGQYGNHVIADENGRVSFALPKKFGRLNLSIKHSGFGPYWADFSPGNHLPEISGEFIAELDAGWIVGGIVVDEHGEPVEGVEVKPSVKHKMRPGDTSRLGVGTRIKTDADGKWRFEHVPASKSDVHVEVSHPSFQPHYQRLARDTFGLKGDAQPSAKIQLKRGLSVTGTVTDEAGQPIEGALIRTKFVNDLREAKTNREGVYKLEGCDEKMARIVVSASGKATDMQTVRVVSDMEPVNFVMKPGGHVKIRVVDENGKGVPKARIFYQDWRRGQAYWEFDHKPDYADENGVWEWNEAPLDEFTADICRPGGMQLVNQRLFSRDEEFVFTPPKMLVIFGKVTDAKTQKPIDKFRVVPGTRDDPDFQPGIRWDSSDAFDAQKGAYTFEQNRTSPAHLVRIEAEGYKVASSREIKSNEGKVEVDFALEPAEKITVQLQDSDGAPAIAAEVVIGVASNQISIKNGDIGESQTYAHRLKSDADGRFTIASRDEPFQIVVMHESGFAHLESTETPVPEILTLTPWARAVGTYRIGNKPAANIRLNLSGNGLWANWPGPNIFSQNSAKTDANGHFEFPRVFPGRSRIGRQIDFMMNDGATVVASAVRPSAEFVAGETTTINLGGTGRPVTGRLVPPADFKEQVLWNFAIINAEADLQPPKPDDAPADVADDPVRRAGWWEAWKTTTQGQEWQQEYQEYKRIRDEYPTIMATVDRDGSFRIDDVPSGRYVLSVYFSSGTPLTGPLDWRVLTRSSGSVHSLSPGSIRDVKFTVPRVEEGEAADAVELGTLQLE